jgi:hypothetical protein
MVMNWEFFELGMLASVGLPVLLYIVAWYKGQLGPVIYKRMGIIAACMFVYFFLMSTGVISKSMNSILIKIWIIVFCARLLWRYVNNKKGN